MQRSIEKPLKEWKINQNRLPIILRGARQVGKSYIVEKFGKENFDSVVTVNFEFQPDLSVHFDSLDPEIICAKLEMRLKERIIPGKTLLFLDEIQCCPQAIVALRYFKEKMANLHVIAAGSLLEFVLHEEKFSFPVGRVEFMYLKPLSFHEYLLSRGFDALVEFLQNVHFHDKIDQAIHQQLIHLLKEYFLIGGMPAVIKPFLENKSFLESQKKQLHLLETFRSDFSKYSTKTQYKYLQIFFENSFRLIGQRFKYSHIDPNIRSRELKIALEQLTWAGLIYPVIATNASGIPLKAYAKDNRMKLLFLDIGLLNSARQIDLQTIWNTDLIHINTGSQAEQFVGQELLAYSNYFDKQTLFFWEKDKIGSLAEVDYVIQIGNNIIPIEVKAGTTGTLKSLTNFINEKKVPFGIRISQHELSYHEKILSVPFYLIEQIPNLIKELNITNS
jgi:predicted AAA+ superfamily ATPase